MKTILDIGVLSITLLLMLTVGMALEWRQFPEVLRRKWMIIAGVLAGQTLILPFLGFALARGLSLSPHQVAGILLLAACPVGDISNFYALLARANVALSVTLNALSCLLTVVTMTIVFSVYGYLLGEQFIFTVPTAKLILKLFLMVVLPVLAGMSLRRFQPEFVARYAKIVRNICLAGIGFVVIYVAVNRWAQMVTEWRQTLVAALTFIGLALLTGMAFARMLRLNGEDRVAIGISFAVRNVALALAIAVTLLNRVEYAVFAMIYFLVEAPLLLAFVATRRRWFAGKPTVPVARTDQ
jgi:bile acid:Na+ symporter, BASS family